MTRPCWSVSAAAVLLLVVSPLLCTSTTVNKKEERDLTSVWQSSSQPNVLESLKTPSNHYILKKVKSENFAAFLYEPKKFHSKDSSNDKLNLLELNILHHNNGFIKLKSKRKSSVFRKQSSVPVLADPGLPILQNVHSGGSSKNDFETSLEPLEARKLTAKRILFYESTPNSENETLREVNAVEHQKLKERLALKGLTDLNTSNIQYAYGKKKLNIQRRNKRSVIKLSDGETVQTVNCVNRSTANNTCKNDGNLIVVLGSEILGRNGSSGRLNNSFSNRNLKAVKETSSLSLSRLTLPMPRKKFVDITDSGMVYRSLSTSEPSHKHWPSLRTGNDTSVVLNKSVNISYMAPSVKPPGRLAAATNAPENLDAASITGITLGSVVFLGIVGAMCFILYKRRNQNKPQTLSDKSSNPDSSVYIEESSDDSEEMYSLDNDSFLNSLEAMTIQNYWTENVKHTKL